MKINIVLKLNSLKKVLKIEIQFLDLTVNLILNFNNFRKNVFTNMK